MTDPISTQHIHIRLLHGKKKKRNSLRNEPIPIALDFTILGRRFWASDMAIDSSTFKRKANRKLT